MKGLRAIACAGALAAVAGCGHGGPVERSDLVAEPNPCAAKQFEVYFGEGEARLTEAARHSIGLSATQLQHCEIRKVTVIGLADASGSAGANQSLSERRALAVTEALVAAGWPAPAFELGAGGEQGAMAPDGTQEPMRRRTEVLIDAIPR
jgi:outer membrane protein OmpA-like peptidoglycan-associated protein